MNYKSILTLVGGISKGSLNQKLFRAVKELSPKDCHLFTYDISELPYFSQDLEKDLPVRVNEFKEKIKEADAVLFITPEYNRSFPGVLKNAIDWGSRPYGQNLWMHKATSIMGASSGNIGTFGAQHQLRQVLAYLDMRVLGQPEFYFNGSQAFDDAGKLTDEKSKKLIMEFWDTFNAWIDIFEHPINETKEVNSNQNVSYH